MKYYNCPATFRNKPYGCGFGPVNATVAFLDMGNTCRCGKELKVWRKSTASVRAKERQDGIDTVRELFGDEAAKNYADSKK